MDRKLGIKAFKKDERTLKAARYMTALPPAPPSSNWLRGITNFGMMLNDSLGDCVAEGTLVDSPDALLGYRSPYCGPVISFTTESGKRLTVTPNHPMLTPAGYLPAYLVKHGDNLVSTRGSQVLPRSSGSSGKSNVDDAPSPIEQKVSALRLSSGSVREVVPIPIHFHGDGKFINGNIEVVGAQSLLGSELHSTLGEPHAKNKVGAARELKSYFHSLRSALKRLDGCWDAFLSDVGVGHQGLSFGFAHAGVAQAYSLAQGSQSTAVHFDYGLYPSTPDAKLRTERFNIPPSVVLSGDSDPVHLPGSNQFERNSRGSNRNSRSVQSSSNRLSASPKDCSNVLREFPGLVHLDRVVNVEENSLSGHVYNLSTDSGRYVSNGIVTHNCTIAACGHATQIWSLNASKEITVPDAEIQSLYSQWCGYVPGDPSTDNGGVELDVLNDWRKSSFDGNTLSAYAAVNTLNLNEVRQAIDLFGGVYIGINLPLACQNQTIWYPVAGPQGVPGSWGGHAVYVAAYGPAGFTCISWGAPLSMTNGFWIEYVEEAYALLSPDFIASNTDAPSGFNLAALQADLALIV